MKRPVLIALLEQRVRLLGSALFKNVNLATQANIQPLWAGLRLVYFVQLDLRSSKRRPPVCHVLQVYTKHNHHHLRSCAKAVRRVDILIHPRRFVLPVQMARSSHHTINHTQVVFFVWLAFRLCRHPLNARHAKRANFKYNQQHHRSCAKAVVKAKVLRRQLQLVWLVTPDVTKKKLSRPFMVVNIVL